MVSGFTRPAGSGSDDRKKWFYGGFGGSPTKFLSNISCVTPLRWSLDLGGIEGKSDQRCLYVQVQ